MIKNFSNGNYKLMSEKNLDEPALKIPRVKPTKSKISATFLPKKILIIIRTLFEATTVVSITLAGQDSSGKTKLT